MTSTALSKRLKVSDSYLKIVKALVKENLVYSTTGKMEDLHLEKLKDITFTMSF